MPGRLRAWPVPDRVGRMRTLLPHAVFGGARSAGGGTGAMPLVQPRGGRDGATAYVPLRPPSDRR
eukprot:574805-Alexandrium_andersonii.AAC.1